MRTRREFMRLMGSGTVGGLLLRSVPLGLGAALWRPRAVHASAGVCFDPVPNPWAAGWTPEGNQNWVTGTPLLLRDTSTAPGDYCNFYCSEPAMFAAEIVLTPKYAILSGFLPASDGNTGVHVTISDGTLEIRAVLVRKPTGTLNVAIRLNNASYSTGFDLPGLSADFTLRRLTDGRAGLKLSGSTLPEEIINTDALPRAARGTLQTIEFGTYNVPAATGTTEWTTLGLPAVGGPIPVAIDIKPGSDPKSINLRSAGVIPVAILSSPTFDATQVDPATVALAGAKVRLIGKGSRFACGIEDVNGDGLPDLMCHVVTADFLIEPGESLAVLEAETYDGQAVRGEGIVRIVP